MSEPSKSQTSKFSGALAKLKNPPAEPPAEPQTPSEKEAPRAAQSEAPPLFSTKPVKATVAKGRRPGKRSDPNYEPTTVLLRKKTKKLANRKLEDTEAGQDLSDLIEQLLSGWIKA